MDAFLSTDLTSLPMYELENVFSSIAINTFEVTYPSEEIKPNTVSIGNVYKNKKYYSCQIKFTENDVICMCNYNVDKHRFTCKFYRLESETDSMYGKLNDEKEGGIAVLKPKYFNKGIN